MVRRHGRRYRVREEEPEPLWMQGMKEVRKIIEATARVAEANRTIPTNFEIDDREKRGRPGEMSIDEAAEVLGVEPDSDLQTAKEAYRNLVKQYHPDQNKSPDAHKKFIKIRTAYDIFKKVWGE